MKLQIQDLFLLLYLHFYVLHDDFELFYKNGFMIDPWIQLAIATPVQFFSGWPFYCGAYHAQSREVQHGHLVVLGTSVAYFYVLYLFAGWGISESSAMHYHNFIWQASGNNS